MPKTKVDLTLLKRLVSELEISLTGVDAINAGTASATPRSIQEDAVELTVEASKAAGIAAGIMAEAGELIMDIQTMVQASQMPKSKSDMLDKIVRSLKGPGTSNN